jgi:triosephosphate isomerase
MLHWCEYCNSWTFRTQSYFNETDALIASKVNTALEHDMTVIFFFGEELKTDNLQIILM